MQFESHATPYGGTPQHRYATLHRALEKGLDSDEVLVELATVCATLGHRSEAFRCVKRIRSVHARLSVEQTLTRRFGRTSEQGADPARSPDKPRTDHHEAPAASNAGPAAQGREQENTPPGVGEHLLDSLQYLMHQHMPWLVLTTMLAFPLVVGVGGFLTAGGSPLLLAAIAALPGISVLAVVAAMARRILLSSANGEGDVPTLPEFQLLVRDARLFTRDAVMVVAIFFGAPIALIAAGAPTITVAPGLLFGAFFAPLGFALRQLRGDMRALSPSIMLRAAKRCGIGYVAIAAVSTLAFAPAAIVTMATLGNPAWVQIALVGPLCVLPMFVTSRLLGSWMDTRRKQLGYLTKNREQAALGNANAPVVNKRQNQQTERRTPKKPAALEKFKAPVVKNRTAAFAPADAAPAPKRRARRKAVRAIEGRRPKPQQQAAPQPAPAPAQERRPVAAGLSDVPDLGGLPGAVVVSGEDRQRQGAASRPTER